ncbi:sulfotransferase [Salinibacter ruber]
MTTSVWEESTDCRGGTPIFNDRESTPPMPTQRKEKYLPDFIIGGAMKCGTSSMHAILSSREDVFIPEGEVHFFTLGDPIQSPETVKFDPERTVFNLNDEKKVEWYRSFFEGADSDQLIGEDSTTYLSSRVAPERIRELLPDVKLIFMLRNPVDRSLSHYRHLSRPEKEHYDSETM